MLRTTIRVKLRRLVTSGWLSLTMIIGIIAAPAYAQQLITNGGFEAGSFAGWTIDNSADSATPGGFYIGNNVSDPALMPHSPSTPLEEFPSVGAASGNYYAVSDDSGPGAHVLLQNFNVSPDPRNVILTFDMFVNDWNGAGALNADDVFDPNQLNGMGSLIPTQFASVDLLAGTASDLTSDLGLLDNLYLGETGFSETGLPNAYQQFSFNITSFVQAGGTYRIRFGDVDNQFTINQGVDNVSIIETPMVSGVPEPSAAIVPAFGIFLCTWVCLRRSRRWRTGNSNGAESQYHSYN